MVAIAIAETLAQAKDAAELVEVDYSELPAAVSVEDAAKEGAPQLHEEAPNNINFEWELGDKAAADEAFAKAHHVTKLDIVNNPQCSPATTSPPTRSAAFRADFPRRPDR